MQKRILFSVFISTVLISFFSWNCTKLDTTDIGADQLPAVDNVNTFDTVLTVNSAQGLFMDSTFVSKADDYALGAINNDPLFGKTTAHVFMQLKPPFFPYYLGNAGDTLVKLDSVVLCLKYKGFWGDSTLPVHLEVREVFENQFRDSVEAGNPTVYQPVYSGPVLGSTDVDVTKLGNYIRFSNGRDSVSNQIRIKLNAAWAAQLYGRDSIANNPVNNAFYSDSIYRRFYNGIAVLATGGGSNGLMYVNIADTATKLEIHYVKKNGTKDSVYTSLRLKTTTTTSPPNAVSNAVNNIIRDRSGRPVLNPPAGEHYLQTAPGTYVNISIPGLSGLSNRIIHRAELIVEQIPTDPILDEKLSAPNFLYLDLKDSTVAAKWKPVYFDLNTTVIYDPDYKNASYPFYPGSIDFNYFGGYRRTKNDLFGNPIKHYTFNISRYVQRIVTQHTYNYDLRLYAPYNLYYGQYSPFYIPFSNDVAFGRVRIGSGTNPNYKLRLRIIYSRI